MENETVKVLGTTGPVTGPVGQGRARPSARGGDGTWATAAQTHCGSKAWWEAPYLSTSNIFCPWADLKDGPGSLWQRAVHGKLTVLPPRTHTHTPKQKKHNKNTLPYNLILQPGL